MRVPLFPVGQVRKIRVQHLRHSTASLLLMKGADLAAVQKIMRHQDPRITTEVYGHLQTAYLKSNFPVASVKSPFCTVSCRSRKYRRSPRNPTCSVMKPIAPTPTSMPQSLLLTVNN